ncbi:MAG: pyruvate kinase, partial [Candidatus Delongbacteria bacterium]|nr:pyruvate kinase [Candidatus Delongbacteria bacterium]
IIGNILLEGKGLNKLSVSGNVCSIKNDGSGIENFTAGDILVICCSTENILQLIKHSGGIITEEDFDDSEAVIVGKALDIPVISNAENATEILKSGTLITIDSGAGKIYSGIKKF